MSALKFYHNSCTIPPGPSLVCFDHHGVKLGAHWQRLDNNRFTFLGEAETWNRVMDSLKILLKSDYIIGTCLRVSHE